MINDIHRKLSSCRSSCKFQQYPTLYATPTPPPNDESSMEVCQVLLLWSIVWSGHYRTHCGSFWKNDGKKKYYTIFMFFKLEVFWPLRWLFKKRWKSSKLVLVKKYQILEESQYFWHIFIYSKWPIVDCRLQRFFFSLWNVCKQHSMVHKFSAIRVEYSFTTPPSITNPMHKLLP